MSGSWLAARKQTFRIASILAVPVALCWALNRTFDQKALRPLLDRLHSSGSGDCEPKGNAVLLPPLSEAAL